ncbi:MAG TPA: ROK family protein [Terriglobia bacterium]|nr:ROK family protein [Terriglobia bacterium]
MPSDQRTKTQDFDQEPKGPLTLAIDIGGTGVKAVTVDANNQPTTPFLRELTPKPPTPKAVFRVIETLAQQLVPFDRVSAGFPGVIKKGVTWTAHNLHPKWIGFDLATELSQLLGKPVRVVNDAAMQGFGAITGKGLELTITLGTGLGSSLFVDGTLVPGLEMAHHPFRKGETYEEQLGKRALDSIGTRRWNRRLKLAIERWEYLFNYDQLYVGGGNAKKVTIKLPANAKLVPNREGLFGGIALWRNERG